MTVLDKELRGVKARKRGRGQYEVQVADYYTHAYAVNQEVALEVLYVKCKEYLERSYGSDRKIHGYTRKYIATLFKKRLKGVY